MSLGMTLGRAALSSITAEAVDGLRQVVQAAAGDVTYLVRVTVAAATPADGTPLGLADGPLAAGPLAGAQALGGGVTGEVRFASDPILTGSADTPADTWIEGRARQPLYVYRSLCLCPESRSDGRQTGDCGFDDADAQLQTDLPESSTLGQAVIVQVGPKNSALTDYQSLFQGTVTARAGADQTVRIGVADRLEGLDRELVSDTYAGTGGLDGDADLTGQPKPLAFGLVRHMRPVLVEASTLLYQVHDGAIHGVDGVYDRGVALMDLGTSTNLLADSVSAGGFKVDLTRGLIRLGAVPSGVLTATVRGDAALPDPVPVPSIALRVLELGGLGAALVNADSFTSLAAVISGGGGWATAGTATVRRALDDLMRGVGASWTVDREGRLKVVRLSPPQALGALLRLDPVSILDLTRMPLPVPIKAPHWRRRVGYRRSWTTLREDQLAAAVSSADRAFLLRQERETVVGDASIRTAFPGALDPPVLSTFLDEKTDAEAVATTLQDLHGQERRMIQVTIGPEGHVVDLGNTVLVTWPDYGLAQGQTFRVVGLREDCARRRVSLILWQ